jgi:hypothetical protein
MAPNIVDVCFSDSPAMPSVPYCACLLYCAELYLVVAAFALLFALFVEHESFGAERCIEGGAPSSSEAEQRMLPLRTHTVSKPNGMEPQG